MQQDSEYLQGHFGNFVATLVCARSPTSAFYLGQREYIEHFYIVKNSNITNFIQI
jgi:hypothetical protein